MTRLRRCSISHDQTIDDKLAPKANMDNVGYMRIKGSITKSSAFNVKTKLNEAYLLKREFPEEAAKVGRPAADRARSADRRDGRTADHPARRRPLGLGAAKRPAGPGARFALFWNIKRG